MRSMLCEPYWTDQSFVRVLENTCPIAHCRGHWSVSVLSTVYPSLALSFFKIRYYKKKKYYGHPSFLVFILLHHIFEATIK